MQVVGLRGWESTRLLSEALAPIESEKILYWGTAHRLNALEQLSRLRAVGILVPDFTTSLDEAKTWAREGEIVYGRRLLHSQGSDIVGAGRHFKQYPATWRWVEGLKWITTKKGARVERPRRWKEREEGPRVEAWNSLWEGRELWTKFVLSIREFRQHVFAGKAIRVGEKTQVEAPTRRQLVRSRKNGWHITYPPPSPTPPDLREIAKLAVSALGYLVGAVDILQREDGRLVVLEVNSAPSVRDPATLGAYVEAVKRWAGKE